LVPGQERLPGPVPVEPGLGEAAGDLEALVAPALTLDRLDPHDPAPHVADRAAAPAGGDRLGWSARSRLTRQQPRRQGRKLARRHDAVLPRPAPAMLGAPRGADHEEAPPRTHVEPDAEEIH